MRFVQSGRPAGESDYRIALCAGDALLPGELAAVGIASIVRHCGDRHGVDEWHPVAGQRPQRRRKCPFTGQRPGGAPFAAALHAGDMQTAETFRVRFEVRASSYPYPAEVQSERELIERFVQ